MASRIARRRWGTVALAACVFGLTAAPAAWGHGGGHQPPPPPANEPGALYIDVNSERSGAAQSLSGQALTDLQTIAAYPAATWFSKGTPAEVQAKVDTLVDTATALGEVPTLVAYYLPFRDCSQYSAGGATTEAEYTAFIDAMAAGIGNRTANLILEPDGLGIIPWYTNVKNELEWCQPKLSGGVTPDPLATSAIRFSLVNYAVTAFGALDDTSVYLDATHSGWLGVQDAADRLIKAGVANAEGFFLNVSNYQYTTNLVYYGTWIAQCLAGVAAGKTAVADCPNQYWNGGPPNWNGTELTPYGEWSDTATALNLWTGGLNARYATMLGGTPVTAHFVVDTSRNGVGPWNVPSAYEDWCNPPGRGLGIRPTTETNNPLVDAFLWVKIPGESDGACKRGTAGPIDPARGYVDPDAGAWFPQMARELILNAVPAEPALTCQVSYWQHKAGPRGFIASVTIKNTGTAAVNGWDLRFAFTGDQRITTAVGASVEQYGQVVQLESNRFNDRIRAGGRVVVPIIGRTNNLPTTEPLVFVLNRLGCSTH